MTAPFALSLQDLAPITEGTSTTDALAETVRLAEAAEALGYTRYGMPSIMACPPSPLRCRKSSSLRRQRTPASCGSALAG